jgi:hypothetical protein
VKVSGKGSLHLSQWAQERRTFWKSWSSGNYHTQFDLNHCFARKPQGGRRGAVFPKSSGESLEHLIVQSLVIWSLLLDRSCGHINNLSHTRGLFLRNKGAQVISCACCKLRELLQNFLCEMGMVVHTYSSGTQRTEAGGWRVWGQCGLHSKTLSQ